MTAPHLVPVRAARISGDDHADRGRARGQLLADGIRATVDGYARLFAELGIPEDVQLAASAASLDALRAWDPDQHREVAGVAQGAGLELVDLGRTLARTEILTRATVRPGECSTVVHRAPGATLSVQTWDWYAQFTGCWHAQRVEALDRELAHAGFAEYGMTGKIGLNAAGVGVHLNILRHRDDDAGGVPVHAVLARVLTHARSVEEAVEIVRSAPTSSSSVLTLVDPDRAVMAEIAAGRVSTLEQEGWGTHTNHFLAEDLQDGAMLLDPASDSLDRLAWLDAHVGGEAPTDADDLLPVMCSPLGRKGVALLPDPTLPERERTATLVTVRLDPARRQVALSPGVPQHAEDATVRYRLAPQTP
ncbi:C45 family autoproteolytic acyltransferase/hydolase [Ornithinimicrobium humiphilum]|uniref:Isopenicillin-N N-acyltransferase-like protein n=1 Tax=Ornithinimicrobium humiphilum TaxID=125288 RepID=A0A543KL58_9MICO|nr:C45 family peptidase [Ornithinimicrobium humiphilum]TQM95823.1 isopenicillin-N N-acyltransferase-like protein [Ornithinimicrobium humiphilum]